MPDSQNITIHKVQEFLGHRAAVYAFTWDKNLDLLSGGGDGWLVQWPLDENGEGKLLAKVEGRLFSLLSIENSLLAGTMNGDLIFLQKKENQWQSRLIKAHDKGVFSIIKVHDGFLTGGGDGYLCKWSFEGEQLLRKKIASNSIRSIALHPNSPVLALSTSAGHIYFIDPNNLEQVTPPYREAHDPSVFASVWSQSGEQLISGGRDALLKIWPYPDFEPKANIIKAHLYTINALAAHPTKNLLATGSRDRTIKIWDKTTFALLKVIDVAKHAGHTASVNALLWNEAGLFSASDDKKIMHWKLEAQNANSTKTDS